MAFLRRRADGRVELRESEVRPAGPRARTLTIFRGTLTPELFALAQARARRPFDVRKLLDRARVLGIPTSERRTDPAARGLLTELRRGAAPSPVMVTLLREALAACPAAELPDELAEVGEWVGVDDARRGRALRGLLRATDRLARGGASPRPATAPRFPRFRSDAGSARASR